MRGFLGTLRWCALLLTLAGCAKEARTFGPDQPQTPPNDASDLREARYGGNAYQIAQGGRYFTWYGCGGCHAEGAQGALNLDDDRWRRGGALDRVYATIAQGHPGALRDYGRRIPAEQLWQITAYVRDLHNLKPGKRRRQDTDQRGEPQGRTWTGPIR